MKAIRNIHILILLIIVIIILFFYNYVYSIYEVKYEISNKILYCNSHSTTKIKAYGINALGYEIVFRNISAQFEIIEGEHLVEVIRKDNSNGEIEIQALDRPGVITIRAVSRLSLRSAIIEIPIQVPSA